ncbi:peptidase domain-containing ABC transporter [Trinickia sp. YCB016]
MRVIYQNEVADCGYACLAMVLTHLGRATEVRELSAFRPISANGLSLTDLYDIAEAFGLSVQAYKFDASDLPSLKIGSILHFGGAHFVVFEKLARGYVQVVDPAAGRRRVSIDTFLSAVSGYLLECAPTAEMPRIRARSRVPAALARMHALNPELGQQMFKVWFTALGSQFAILAMPYLGNLVLDYVVSADNLNLLNVLALTFAGIFAAGALSQYVQAYLVELVSGLARVNVTEGILRHLLRAPLAYFEKRNVGDVFSRVKAQDEINAYATKTLIVLAIDLAVGMLSLTVMAVQSGQLTAVALLIFLAYVVVSFALFPRMRDAHTLVIEESARCDDMLIETIRAASLIKLSSSEARRTARYMSKFKSYAAALLQSERLVAQRDAVLKLINYADLIIVTWLSARLMLKGTLSIGTFYSFSIYKTLMSERFSRSINATFAGLMLSVPAARVGDIVESEQERYTLLPDTQKAAEVKAFDRIAVRDVTFQYGVSDRPVLRNTSIEILRGDKIAITGPSGSGKSTLFKLLAAAEPLQKGEILLNGIAWPNLAVDEIRRHMTHMRQGDIILHGSIADNVSLFAGNADESRIHAILNDVGLLDDIMRLPMRARTVISDTIANISAGQRQRLLLARALYQQRELLLLDEPTSNLDPSSVHRIAELLRGLDRTVVVITHDRDLASAFDVRYELIDGELVPHARDVICTLALGE